MLGYSYDFYDMFLFFFFFAFMYDFLYVNCSPENEFQW